MAMSKTTAQPEANSFGRNGLDCYDAGQVPPAMDKSQNSAVDVFAEAVELPPGGAW
jgi:hypothetical protein